MFMRQLYSSSTMVRMPPDDEQLLNGQIDPSFMSRLAPLDAHICVAAHEISIQDK